MTLQRTGWQAADDGYNMGTSSRDQMCMVNGRDVSEEVTRTREVMESGEATRWRGAQKFEVMGGVGRSGRWCGVLLRTVARGMPC